MGVIKVGILGGFSGTVGTVVGAKWRTLDVIKSRPRKTGKVASKLQLDQRSRFGLITHFFKDLKNVVDLGYQSKNKLMSPMNTAVQYHLNNAVTGTSPNFTIDFSKVVLAMGNLESAGNITGTTVAGRKIMVSWEYAPEDFKEEERSERASDKAMLVVYDETKKYFLSSSRTVTRSGGKLEVTMPRMTAAGNTLHSYFFFISSDNKSVSKSEYLGPLKAIA